MDTATLNDLTNEINNMETCEALQAFKTQVLTLMNAQHSVLSSKQTDLLTLTNPVTFIANFITIILRELATVESLATQSTSDINTITALLATKAAKLPNCTLS